MTTTTGDSPHCAALREALSAVTLGEPVSWRGLTLFPLLRPHASDSRYDGFGAAHAAGTFRIGEVSEAGVVGEIEAVNDGDRGVLLLDGEEVVGAKQNRIVNLTVLVPRRSRVRIPVSCVEQGRWNLQSKAFSESGRAVFARERARKMRDVTSRMRTSGHAAADQGAVWDSVAAELNQHGISSPTGAMSALFDQQQALDSYLDAFTPFESQVGAVYCVGGRVAGLELFDSTAAYAASAAKVIRSYAHGIAPGTPAVANEADVAAFMNAIGAVPATVHEAPGAGMHVRFETEQVLGAALVHEDVALHLIAFVADQSDTGSPDDDATPRKRPARARDLIRAGRMRCEPAGIFSRTPPPLGWSGPQLRDRIEGMLLGLAIGDALGNTTESQLPAHRRARHGEVRDYLPNVHAGGPFGVPSDDTQMAFWTLRRLTEDGELMPARLAREFCAHRIFGIGGTVRAFIRAHKDEGVPWWQAGQESAGNGALMRIAPVLVPHVLQPSPQLWSDAAMATMITHNDPAALGASVALVEMLWSLLRMSDTPSRGWWLDSFTRTLREVEGDAPRYMPRLPGAAAHTTLWGFTRERVGDALHRDVDTMPACDSWFSGAYLLETVPSFLYILERHGHDPEEAIVRAVNDTKDNDTIGAIVGAAVGALHGRAALPRRWIDGLLGRTSAADDGEVFRMIDAACERFVA